MLTRSALIYLSRQEGLKEFAAHFKPFRKMTTRFVAGETIAEAVAAIRELNAAACSASFDHLNESVANAEEAEKEIDEYLRILEQIDQTGINSNVSIKLTQFGLELDPELAYTNARSVVEGAARRGNFVRVDMESSSVTQVTIDIFKRLRSEFGLNDVGIVLQSYLRRTYADAQELLKLPARIRICKGAYNEPASVAFPKKSDVDANYLALAQAMLSAGPRAAGSRAVFGTHDLDLIAAIRNHAQSIGLKPGVYEFHMLYGIQKAAQLRLTREGAAVRVLIAYGEYWFPWYMRRLAERPANVWFVAKSLFG